MISFKEIYRFIRNFILRMKTDHVAAYAAQAAFFMMLSFIPIIMLLLSLIKYTPVTESMLQRLFSEGLPSSVYPMILTIIDEVYDRSFHLLPVTALIAAWSAGKAVMALTVGFNNIYEVKETRNYFAVRIRSTIYTLFVLLSIVLSLSVMVFGNYIQKMISNKIPFIAHITGFVLNFRFLLILAMLTLFFTLIYRYLPNRKAPVLIQVPGAVFTSAAWMGFSYFFSLYVDHFAGYSKIYGSLTTLVLAMLWLYACMYIVMIGAAINSYYEGKFLEFRENARRKKFKRGH